MADEPNAEKKQDETPNKLVINYLKSNFFRVIHSDGAWVGLTPNLAVNIIVFSERAAIPKRMTHEVGADGAIGAEILAERESKDGLVRELEASVVMQPERVKALIAVLQKMLDQLEEMKTPEQPSPECPK